MLPNPHPAQNRLKRHTRRRSNDNRHVRNIQGANRIIRPDERRIRQRSLPTAPPPQPQRPTRKPQRQNRQQPKAIQQHTREAWFAQLRGVAVDVVGVDPDCADDAGVEEDGGELVEEGEDGDGARVARVWHGGWGARVVRVGVGGGDVGGGGGGAGLKGYGCGLCGVGEAETEEAG